MGLSCDIEAGEFLDSRAHALTVVNAAHLREVR